jgi:phosphocarrier protein HPr
MVVLNEIGLHARPAAMLARLAGAFDSEVLVQYRGKTINAKSIIGILTLGAARGAEVTVVAVGWDAAKAIRAIDALFASAFNEHHEKPDPVFSIPESEIVGVSRQWSWAKG